MNGDTTICIKLGQPNVKCGKLLCKESKWKGSEEVPKAFLNESV